VDLPEVHVAPLTIATIGVAAFVSILFFPFSKTIWAAVDLTMHRVDPTDADSIARTFGLGDRPMNGWRRTKRTRST
jgi:hypothetical protein